MKTLKELKIQLSEAIDADHYEVTSEKSSMTGGHRPKIVHKRKGTTMHLSQHSYKTAEHAKKHAQAYLDAYERVGPNAAERAGHDHYQKNKEHIVVKEEVDQIDELSKATLGAYVKKSSRERGFSGLEAGASGSGTRVQKDAVNTMKKRQAGVVKAVDRLTKEETELQEARINGREYASHGLMHPDHSKMNIHQPSSQHVDFYASGTGDKMQGKVTKNDGKHVHIQAHKELGDGKLHKFKITPHLPKTTNEETDMNEELKGDQHKIDANKNGKLDKFDFAKLRARRKQMQEKMDLSAADMGDVVKDFQKSDAPQFAGKSDKKRQQMAVAAKLEADRKSMKEEFQGFSSFLKVHEDITEEIIEEGMIGYSDFNSMMDAQKKAGNRILDYKHGEKSAHYVVVDKEGTKRKVTYTQTGKKMENLGGSTDKEKPAAPAEKRGRGRPKGSASGARLKGSAKDNDDDSGLDDTRYSMHLPSGRR